MAKRKNRRATVIDYIIGIPFALFLTVLASLCYLTQHTYNFIRGRGWAGMSL